MIFVGTLNASVTNMHTQAFGSASRFPLGLALALGALTSCSGTVDSGGGGDDAAPDVAAVVDSGDAAAADTWSPDVTAQDVASGDASAKDSAAKDATAADVVAPDAAGQDAATPDAGPDDAAADAAEHRDASLRDSGGPDSSDASVSTEASAGPDSGADAQDACVENVLCVAGYHWDPTTCMCVVGTCISQDGGPCGGFTSNPCQCAPGLECVSNPIPDIPGTCGPPIVVCDPIECKNGETWEPMVCACAPQACTTSTDCTGSLPQLCEVCVDGASGCAHWECDAGACQTAYCP
jgi:hypothetical protein